MVDRLLAANADVNGPAAELFGRTALQAAEKRAHFEIVRRLKQAGASDSTLKPRH
jgi:hypothetical protein